MPTATKLPRTARARAGFTLIEIMVVIAIIGLLLTVVAPNVWNNLRKAKVTTTKMKMAILKGAVGEYRNDFNKVPDTLEQLLEQSEKHLGEPYLEKQEELLDSWDNPFRYTKVSNTKFDIISLGADGVEGGENDDKDISILDDAMPVNAK
jgi:general secretion pathway protein G